MKLPNILRRLGRRPPRSGAPNPVRELVHGMGVVALLLYQGAAGLQEASFAGHIPELASRLHLSNAQILGATVALTLSQILAGFVAAAAVPRLGIRPLAAAAALGFGGLCLATVSDSYWGVVAG